MREELKKCIKEIKENKELNDIEKRYLYALAFSIFKINPCVLENISFNGYAECCLCIIKEKDEWKLCDAERGTFHNIIKYDTLDSLCYDVINKSFNCDTKDGVIDIFNTLMIKERIKVKKK